VLHVVGVRAAVAPDIARDPTRRPDVVVAADLADLLFPGPDADEGGAFVVGEDLLGFLDVDDHIRAERDGDAEALDGGGGTDRGLDRIAGADPPVVPAVEETDVVDAGIAQDHQRACRRDLTGSPSRPLLVRLADGVAAIQHHGRVAGDAEAAEGRIELLRGAAVPIGRILERVRIQVQGARDMAFLVLVRHAEVDVEQDEPAFRRRLGTATGQDLAQPLDVDEPVVPWQLLDREAGVRGPGAKTTLEDAAARNAEGVQPGHEGLGVAESLSVDDHFLGRSHALAGQEPVDLGGIDAREPG